MVQVIGLILLIILSKNIPNSPLQSKRWWGATRRFWISSWRRLKVREEALFSAVCSSGSCCHPSIISSPRRCEHRSRSIGHTEGVDMWETQIAVNSGGQTWTWMLGVSEAAPLTVSWKSIQDSDIGNRFAGALSRELYWDLMGAGSTTRKHDDTIVVPTHRMKQHITGKY